MCELESAPSTSKCTAQAKQGRTVTCVESAALRAGALRDAVAARRQVLIPDATRRCAFAVASARRSATVARAARVRRCESKVSEWFKREDARERSAQMSAQYCSSLHLSRRTHEAWLPLPDRRIFW